MGCAVSGASVSPGTSPRRTTIPAEVGLAVLVPDQADGAVLGHGPEALGRSRRELVERRQARRRRRRALDADGLELCTARTTKHCSLPYSTPPTSNLGSAIGAGLSGVGWRVAAVDVEGERRQARLADRRGPVHRRPRLRSASVRPPRSEASPAAPAARTIRVDGRPRTPGSRQAANRVGPRGKQRRAARGRWLRRRGCNGSPACPASAAGSGLARLRLARLRLDRKVGWVRLAEWRDGVEVAGLRGRIRQRDWLSFSAVS